MAQFVDFLSSKILFLDAVGSKPPREAAMQVFNDLDAEGEGVLDVTWLLSVSVSSTNPLCLFSCAYWLRN